MNLNKICPECGTEYLPQIETCSDCGVLLIREEDYKISQERKKRLMETEVENRVAVREGDLDWLSELYKVLINAGIPCTINSGGGCKKGCCDDTSRLMVSSADLERAQAEIEAYFEALHPEARVSRELAIEGRCPACGSPITQDNRECQDCGLLLVIEGED
jgi:rRNA maturation endonuclease Nob1